MLGRLEVFDHFLAFFQPNEGFFPIRPVSGIAADPPFLPGPDLRPNIRDLDLEQLFDGFLDLGFIRGPSDGEADLVVLLLEDRAFLGDHGPKDDLSGILAH
jgi:hypothetical protein